MASAALAISAGLQAAGSVTGGIMAQQGAEFQAEMAQRAADIAKQEGDTASQYQQQATDQIRRDQSPFYSAGAAATRRLSDMVAPGGELSKGWDGAFKPPTAEEAAQTPGYQFALEQGRLALERSAAAQGNLLSGGTLKDLARYTTGVADQNYQQVYNNSFQQYQQRYNEFLSNQANLFNKNLSLSAIGQNSANSLDSLTQAGAKNYGDIRLTSADMQGRAYMGKGEASASGMTALGNGTATALSDIGGAFTPSMAPKPYATLGAPQSMPSPLPLPMPPPPAPPMAPLPKSIYY